MFTFRHETHSSSVDSYKRCIYAKLAILNLCVCLFLGKDQSQEFILSTTLVKVLELSGALKSAIGKMSITISYRGL